MSASAAERMRALRERRRSRAEREIRITVPDARSQVVRNRVAQSVSGLDSAPEAEALAWIEAVAELDEDHAR
ncbi:MAG: hypothetical protein OXH96_18270 [Spirochaetaceae bacterium]|nr:hypothetical protein [Spirochaetaceae bacterium]